MSKRLVDPDRPDGRLVEPRSFGDLGKEVGGGLDGLISGLEKSKTGRRFKRMAIIGAALRGAVAGAFCGGVFWLVKYAIDSFAGN